MNSPIELPFDSASLVRWAKANAPVQGTVLLFVAEASKDELPEVLDEFKKLEIVCAGAIFPGLIVGTKTFRTGFVIQQFDSDIGPVLIENVDNIADKAWEALPSGTQFNEGTVFVFADVACKLLGNFLHQLYGQLGNRCRYFGAGAGSIKNSIPSIFTAEKGIKSGAVVLAFSKANCEFQGQHGWSRSSPPVVVTKAKDNAIQELNGKRAFSVYSEMVEEMVGEPVSPKQMYEKGVEFPLGMIQEGAQDIVRCPIATSEDGHLLTVGGVYPNSVLHMLTSTEEELTAAANLAATECSEQTDFVGGSVLIMDCISRFVEGAFEPELKTIEAAMAKVEPKSMVGALTKGEISSRPNEYPLWLNKVVVVGVFDF